MSERVWEWLLPDGLPVRASYDPERDLESVWVGDRLVVKARSGRRPEGHLVWAGAYRATEVRVRFDSADACTLYRGADVVAPHRFPASARRRSGKGIALVACTIGALSVAAAIVFALLTPTSDASTSRVAVDPKARGAAAPQSAPAPAKPPERKAIQPAPRPLKPATQFVTAPTPPPRSTPSSGAGAQRTARAIF